MFEKQTEIEDYFEVRPEQKVQLWNLVALGLREHFEIQSSELYLKAEFTHLATGILEVRLLRRPKYGLSLADWLRVTGNYETFYVSSWRE